MFSGVIEHLGEVASVADGGDDQSFRRISIVTPFTDVKLGESIAVNGACLTVADIRDSILSFDVIAETLDKTNLGLLSAGDAVHIERSLRMGDRIDGHMVQGHVDGVARLMDRIDARGQIVLKLQAPAAVARYLVPKGAVALDGISLTVASVEGPQFEVALIPTTIQRTLLAKRPIGSVFNVEADILGKTIVSTLERFRDAGRM